MKVFTDAEIIKAAIRPLLSWYEDNSRILPWRETPSPYGTWISEIMLQQTRVEAVIAYYYRFMERFPDISSLAKTEEDELFALWQGLGYYRRAAMLLNAAQEVEDTYHGTLPADFESLLALPGIGRYTAGAIASIGFGLPYPAVDGNVLRVLSRLLASHENIADEKVKTAFEKLLTAVMPQENPGTFNQSLMELGALICIPNGAPKCQECPVKLLCKGYQQGMERELPVKAKKKVRKVEERTVFLFTCQDKIALHQRGKKGLLAKLWEYPNVLGHQKTEEVQGQFPSATIKKMGKAKHVFTHIEWHMIWYEVAFDRPVPLADCVWVSKEALGDYAIASAFKKVLK